MKREKTSTEINLVDSKNDDSENMVVYNIRLKKAMLNSIVKIANKLQIKDQETTRVLIALGIKKLEEMYEIDFFEL